MGEQDVLNSTANVPQDRFASGTPDRCVSDPLIDLIAFDDEVPAGQLETRIRTRSRGVPDDTDNRLRDEYTQLKIAVVEWGERICSSTHTVDVIEREHNSLRAQIEHKMSDVLIRRGDYNLVNELVSLRDQLGAASREARQMAQNQIQACQSQTSRGVIHEEEINDLHSTEISREGYSNEEVFEDDFVVVDERVDFERRKEPDHTRNVESVLAGRLEPSSVQGSAVQTHHQGVTSLRTRQDLYDEQLVEIQDMLKCISTSLEKTETSNRELLEEMTNLKCCYNEVSQRLDTDGLRMDNLDKIISRLENKVDDNLKNVQDWFVHLTTQPTTEVPREIVETLQDVINDSAPARAVDRMRDELQDLRDSMSMSQHVTDGLRGLVVDMSEQLSNSNISQSIFDENLRSRDYPTLEINRRECEIVKKGIQRAEKQLRRLVLNGLEMRPTDISLIRKHKTVDIPCVHAAIGSIQKSLQRYVKFPEVDMQYCEGIDVLLDEAETWCSKVEELYNDAEIHSINMSKGDVADIGMFSDNTKITVYEFLEAAEIAYLGWGNSIQKENRLYNRHLSEEIKAKLVNKSDSYADMKIWLVQNYGGVSRIINDIIGDLARRTKPNFSNNNAKFTFYALTSSALLRIERLSKVEGIDKLELDACLYSRATLSSLSLLLPSDAYTDWISEMTKAGMDYKNPEGEKAYVVFKDLCVIERNKSEGSRTLEKASSPKLKPRSPKASRTKPKSVHNIATLAESDPEEMQDSGVFATSYHKVRWYLLNLRFPCPIAGHNHEISTCEGFFSLNPTERWNKMDKGKLCYTCLSPKDVCVRRKCESSDKVPDTLKCQGCAP